MNDPDKLLDEVAARLRNEPVPDVPEMLTTGGGERPRRWRRRVVVATAVAASLALLLLWQASMTHGPEPPVANIAEPSNAPPAQASVTVQPVDITAPLTQIEVELNSMDTEIDELMKQADLLDAQRMADELVAEF